MVCSEDIDDDEAEEDESRSIVRDTVEEHTVLSSVSEGQEEVELNIVVSRDTILWQGSELER